MQWDRAQQHRSYSPCKPKTRNDTLPPQPLTEQTQRTRPADSFEATKPNIEVRTYTSFSMGVLEGGKGIDLRVGKA